MCYQKKLVLKEIIVDWCNKIKLDTVLCISPHLLCKYLHLGKNSVFGVHFSLKEISILHANVSLLSFWTLNNWCHLFYASCFPLQTKPSSYKINNMNVLLKEVIVIGVIKFKSDFCAWTFICNYLWPKV